MQKASVFKRYFLPGFAFQSVVIAGGYGTGRELAEFFLTIGPLGGLLAMVLISTVIWSAVSAASFELARVYRCHDYRSFFQVLLGRFWFLYELCYFALMLIVLAVIAAAAGSILEQSFGLPYAVGVIAIMAAVGFLAFRGTTIIEKFFAGWSFVLYGVYIVFFVWCFVRFGPAIKAGFGAEPVGTEWMVAGVRYAAYNLALIPAILFTLRHTTTRREAVGAGLLAGPIAMFPALLFYLAMVGQYPQILDETVPANFLLDLLGSRAFQLTFQIVLFGTLVETGTGMIHALNERLATRFRERGIELPPSARPVIAVLLLIVGALVASFGLIDLIAKGYGTLTWLFLLVFVAPVLTIGIWKIRTRSISTAGTDGEGLLSNDQPHSRLTILSLPYQDETMSKLNCPHCGKPAITVTRKMWLGPAVPATCKACGKKVGVSYMAMLASISPFLAAIVGSAIVEPFALKAALWIGGSVAMAVIHMRWVPLEPR